MCHCRFLLVFKVPLDSHSSLLSLRVTLGPDLCFTTVIVLDTYDGEKHLSREVSVKSPYAELCLGGKQQLQQIPLDSGCYTDLIRPNFETTMKNLPGHNL